jgi:hypothetical protein
MIADVMTGVSDGTDDGWVLLGLLADDEKRGAHTKLCQNVEDTRGEHRVGTIVKGQRYGTAVGWATSHRPRLAARQQIGADGIQRSAGSQPA